MKSEQVKKAARIASVVLGGEPLTDRDYRFLSDHGAANWALYGLYKSQNVTGDRFTDITGNPVPEESTSIFEELLALSGQRQIMCDDISDLVGDRIITLTSEERQNLIGSVLHPRWAISDRRAKALRRCVERFFIRQ